MKPAYVRRVEDPIACSAIRLKREALDTFTDAKVKDAASRISMTLKIAVDVMGAEYIRALLLRPLLGTFVGDEIESRGIAATIHPGPEFLTVEEIHDGAVKQMVKKRWTAQGEVELPIRFLKEPPDIALLTHPRRDIFKMRKGIGSSSPRDRMFYKWERPIDDVADNVTTLVASIAHDRAWGGRALSVSAASGIASMAAFVGVRVNEDDVTNVVHARYDEVRKLFLDGKTYSSAQAAYFDKPSKLYDTRQQPLFGAP